MKISVLTIFVISLLSFSGRPDQTRVLIFTKTNGWHHTSIPAGIRAIQKLALENNFVVDSTTDSLQFTEKNLSRYAAVIFLNTTGDVLGDVQQVAFEKFIRSGKGFVGVHSACDTEYKWPWYNKLVGAYFLSHPEQQTAKMTVTDSKFSATGDLPATWNKWDEWYNYKETNWDKMNILITLDEKSYKGGKNGDYHPISWYHNYDGGRAFYTGMGHTDETYSDSLFLKHLYGGIKYAIGK